MDGEKEATLIPRFIPSDPVSRLHPDHNYSVVPRWSRRLYRSVSAEMPREIFLIARFTDLLRDGLGPRRYKM